MSHHKKLIEFSDFLKSITSSYDNLSKELQEKLDSLQKDNSSFTPKLDDSQLFFIHFYMMYPPHNDRFFHVFAKNREDAISKIEELHYLDSLDFDYHVVDLVSDICHNKSSKYYFLEGKVSLSNESEIFNCTDFLNLNGGN